jgi:hypothetical protein
MPNLKKFLANFGWKTQGQEAIVKPLKKHIKFELKYEDLLIGILEWSNGFWIFEYSEDFKLQSRLKLIPDFPTVDKVYQSTELYPFFVQRIPSLKQPKVQQTIKKENIENTDEATMLRLFGYRTISNPFLLSLG